MGGWTVCGFVRSSLDAVWMGNCIHRAGSQRRRGLAIEFTICCDIFTIMGRRLHYIKYNKIRHKNNGVSRFKSLSLYTMYCWWLLPQDKSQLIYKMILIWGERSIWRWKDQGRVSLWHEETGTRTHASPEPKEEEVTRWRLWWWAWVTIVKLNQWVFG